MEVSIILSQYKVLHRYSGLLANRFPKRHVTSLVDWAVDLGYGYGTDCNTSTAPREFNIEEAIKESS